MSKKYLVRLNGLNPSSDPFQVRQNLLSLFNASHDQLEKILSTPGYVLKTGLSKEVAEIYRTKVVAAGAFCFVEEAGALEPLSVDLPDSSNNVDIANVKTRVSQDSESIRKNTAASDLGGVGFIRRFAESYKTAKKNREAFEKGESESDEYDSQNQQAGSDRTSVSGGKIVQDHFSEFGSIISGIFTILVLGGILYWLAITIPMFAKYFEPSSDLEKITLVGVATRSDFQKFKDNGGLDAAPNWHGLYVVSYKSQYSNSDKLEAVSLGVSGKSKWSSLVDRWSVERGLSSKDVRAVLSKVCKADQAQWEHTDGDLSWGAVKTRSMNCSYSPGESGAYMVFVSLASN